MPMRLTIIGLVIVVLGAAFILGQTLRSKPALPVLAASYTCIPGSLIPQLNLIGSATMTTKYGGFTASYRATKTANETTFSDGTMPFNGTLTMSGGGTNWTLPRPANTSDKVINAMCVIAFQREQHPGVMIEGFTGGAHCCEVAVVYLFNQQENRYVKVVDMSPNHYKFPHAFDANQGYFPTVAGRQVLLKTGDGVFAYAFDCYACSALPIVLDSVSPSGLTDVTLQNRALVVANAQAIWKSAQKASGQNGAGAFGLLPAWVADECALGRGAAAWSTIEGLQRQGKLSDALYQDTTFNHGSYVTSLKSFLLRNDYCVGQI
jgi:hypothetical protein